MEFIFKSAEYKREYKDLLKILPALNECNLCMKIKCENCKNYTFTCRSRLKEKCKNCDLYMTKRDTLLENPNRKAADYVFNFLTDCFNSNDLTRQFFKLNISDEIIKENVLLNVKNFFQKINKKYVANNKDHVQYNLNG